MFQLLRRDIAGLASLARQGDLAARMTLVDCWLNGRGVEENEIEAVRWYCEATKVSVAEAEFKFGAFFEGKRKDSQEAIRWFRRAAEHGHAKAQYMMVLWHAEKKFLWGFGIATGCYYEEWYTRGEKNQQEAVYWLRKAAGQGFDMAQVLLGSFYCQGAGVEKNYQEALCWCRKAMEQEEVHPNAKMCAEKYCNLLENSRAVYIWVAIFFGVFGLHNIFVAHYCVKGILQLCITLFSCGFLSPIVFIWAMIEVFTVRKNIFGIPFR